MCVCLCVCLCARMMSHSVDPPDNELVDVVELIPVLIARVHIAEQGLKLGPAWNAHVEALGCDERRRLKQIKVVAVHKV